MHWATAIPFVICYSTALILITVYNPNPARPLRWLVSWTHRLSGLCLLLAPLGTIVRHRHEIEVHRENIAQVWRWTRDDLRWLSLIAPASFFRNIELPHQGKFNAGEKINFVVLTSSYPLYVMTGLAIWLGGAAYLAWMIHFSLATIATPLIFGHILMATVNPDTRPGLSGMITGFVDREWARHHYRIWYEKHHGKSARRVVPALDVPAPAVESTPTIVPTHAPRPHISPVAPRSIASAPQAAASRATSAVPGRTSPGRTQTAVTVSRTWLACLDCISRRERTGTDGERRAAPDCLACALEAGAQVIR